MWTLIASFRVGVDDVLSELPDGIDRILSGDTAQVGGVEVDAKPRRVDVANEAKQNVRKLRAGFDREHATDGSGILRRGAHRAHHVQYTGSCTLSGMQPMWVVITRTPSLEVVSRTFLATSTRCSHS